MLLVAVDNPVMRTICVHNDVLLYETAKAAATTCWVAFAAAEAVLVDAGTCSSCHCKRLWRCQHLV